MTYLEISEILSAYEPKTPNYWWFVVIVITVFYACLQIFLWKVIKVPAKLNQEFVAMKDKIDKKIDEAQRPIYIQRAEKLRNQKFGTYLNTHICVFLSPGLALAAYTYACYHEFNLTYTSDDYFYETQICSFGLPYWILDTVLILVGVNLWEVDLIFHHIITILPSAGVFLYNSNISLAFFMLFIGESTGLFLQFKLINDHKLNTGIFSVINSQTFCFQFIYMRLFYAYPYIVIISMSEIQVVLKVIISLAYWIGFIWSWEIFNLLPKKLSQMYPDNKQFGGVYAFMKSLRPYAAVYYVLSLLFCCKDLIYKDLMM